MAEEYTLQYTGEQINERLTKAGNAVLFTSQSLTEAQKTQAKENLGVTDANFYVTATVVSGADDDYECTADKTMAEITAAYNSNKSVCLRFSPVNANYLLIPLVTCQSGAIGFSLYAGGESAGSLGGGMWEALIEDDESFYVTRKEVSGSSGVYVLSDGESLDNVPESAVLVIDPGDTGGNGGDGEDTHALYNGVEFPKIPEELKASYTYFVIITAVTGSPLLIASPNEWYYTDRTGLGKMMTTKCTYYAYLLQNDAWVFDVTYTDDGNYPFEGIVWANHDIRNGSATATDIYFEGSDPVPIGGVTEEPKPDVLYVRNPATGQLEPLEVGSPDAVLYTEQTLAPEQQAQARENIGAAEATPTRTATYNDGDTVTLSNVQGLVLNGKTRTENSKNLCSLSRAEVVTGPENAYLDFDIEEIPAGQYAISANITSTATAEYFHVLFMTATDDVVLDILLSMESSTDGRMNAVWLSPQRAFSKLRMYAVREWYDSLNQTTIYSDIQIEATPMPTAYEPYYKAGDGIPAEVSFDNVKFSADAELFNGDTLNFANGSLTRKDGTVSTIPFNGNIFSLNGEYELSSAGTVTIATAQVPPYVRYDAQLLNKEQKAQARANIGVDGFDCDAWGLPVLRLTGSTEGMTKENAVTLNYEYGERRGSCTCKWQGGSSIILGESYGGKHNFTIKFDTAFEAHEGWGAQKKYCTKANVIDHSHARNLLSAKLWGQIVKSRSTVPAELSGLPNYGAVDGFPIIITLNGEFHGLYTFNIPKDGWMFGMGNGTQEAIICADKHVGATAFKAPALVDESDFELEYVTDENNAGWVVTSVNRLINACINSNGTDLDTTIAQYLDWQSAIDYYIFTVLLSGHDMTDKNYILATFDGVKWYFSAYDLDSTYGLLYDGSQWLTADWAPTFEYYASAHRVMELIKTYKKDALKARYNALRATVLSESNVATVLNNFTGKIPDPVYMQDAKKWPLLPNTSTSNATQIRDYYRMRVAYADKWMEQL